MSGIVGGINLRSSGLVNNSSASDGQVFTGTGAGLPAGFEAAAGGGKVLQIQSVLMTVTSRTTTSTSLVDITGFTVNITPASTDSKILAMAVLHTGTGYDHATRASFVRDSTVIGNTQASCMWADGVRVDEHTMITIDQPASTSELVYKMQWLETTSGTRYLNRSGNSAYTSIPSSIILIELEAATVTTVSS